MKSNEQFNRKVSEKLVESGRLNEIKLPAALEPVASDSQSKINESLNSNKSKEVPKSTPSVQMPVNFYKFENATTVTNLVGQLKDNQNKKLLTGLCCSTNEPDDSFLTDLAVGAQVSYLKVGGFNRAERVAKLNRLFEIEQYLSEKNMLTSSLEQASQTSFHYDFEIPADYNEAIQAYTQQIEDLKLGRDTTKSKK